MSLGSESARWSRVSAPSSAPLAGVGAGSPNGQAGDGKRASKCWGPLEFLLPAPLFGSTEWKFVFYEVMPKQDRQEAQKCEVFCCSISKVQKVSIRQLEGTF